jgi:MFS family permease
MAINDFLAQRARPGTDSKIGFAVRALRHRNYRLFFAGHSLSLIGTWMTQVATSWLVYRLTNSAFLLGLVGCSAQIPALLLAPFCGVWVDRMNRLRLLKLTQTLSMLESFALAALAFTHSINIWNIIGLTAFQGTVNALDLPGRQSLLVKMVEDRGDLANAIALNSLMLNCTRLVGPSIAGVVIALSGEKWCFLIDGFSYLAVIASLFMMRVSSAPIARKKTSVFHELKTGWDYVVGLSPIRSILILVASVGLVGMPYGVLMPIFAGSVLHGDAHTLGFLTATAGLGALASAIVLAMRKTAIGLGRWVAMCTFLFGAGLIGFGFSHWLWLSLPLILVTGFCTMQQTVASNIIIQTMVDEDKRGRVMSFYTMVFVGMAPFGSLMAGGLANSIGAPRTVMIGGVLCMICAEWFDRAQRNWPPNPARPGGPGNPARDWNQNQNKEQAANPT